MLEESGLFIILPGLNCYSFTLTSTTGHSRTNKCPKIPPAIQTHPSHFHWEEIFSHIPFPDTLFSNFTIMLLPSRQPSSLTDYSPGIRTESNPSVFPSKQRHSCEQYRTLCPLWRFPFIAVFRVVPERSCNVVAVQFYVVLQYRTSIKVVMWSQSTPYEAIGTWVQKAPQSIFIRVS